ncbi:rho GTPase-activating protein 6 isoform X1 [Bombyx mandarina]|uniref:Rho GTPase-activating protein 6 isoform X1 n=1 Tax=Bombyx mandarina TaxID=7092 RepID=A0A6J2K3X7_BOMMA|nr:rho GTPase-activating protein 6 isoform X1 [Bombyx mandarina]XP_028036946.1 rho GTPase-activating protein 6 isoform X1 [Bombyx mandarina]
MERRRRPDSDPMTKVVRRREKPRERWLLTRKTWKYMSDAGRRLVPDGAQNRPEDVGRIEAYFQEVCAKEPRFVLRRKSSYPAALPKPRRKARPRGGSVRARSPSDDAPPRPTDLFVGHISGGRFDIAKLRKNFFAAPPPSASSAGFNSRGPHDVHFDLRSPPVIEEETSLVDLLRKYLKLEEESSAQTKISETEELIRALREYLKRNAERAPSDADGDPAQRHLLDSLSRHYIRSPNRDVVVQDLLADRNLLKRLYHDLRKTKPYRGARSGGSGGGGSGGGYSPGVYGSCTSSRCALRPRSLGGTLIKNGEGGRSPPMSPPPLIEVFQESFEDKFVNRAVQTLPIPEDVLSELERVYREKLEAATAPTSPTSPPPERKPGRRRSSIDHDDVSQSVSDTIKRYLRMARKKSVDSEKVDRFKRINYDKNLRNIKPRMPGEVDDDGPHKGCQTEEGWILTYRDLQFASVASTPTSPPSPASPSLSHSFLSTLLGRSAPAVAPPAGGMQKSRSSSSVVQSVSKRLWRTRSRSSSRASCTWSPQGSCCWVDGSGRCVRLTDTSLLSLTEVERRALQQAALARLQQINLGTTIKIPEDNTVVTTTKPKRRTYMLKKKALTTGFFDQSRTKDADKDKEAPPRSMFGIPLSQCVETERALRRQLHGGSRASLASLGALEKADDSESCDSGDWGWTGLEEAGGGGPKVPALITACIAHLRRHGLNATGLFRVSSSKQRVRQLREDWERCQEAALDSVVSPHDVAALLKEFLRDLPDPLLCRDLYSAFLHTQKIHNRHFQWEAIRLIVQLLPAAHRDTLNVLLSFLSQLAEHSGDEIKPGHKMDPGNLATIFAPNILHRNKPNEPASVEQLSERTDVINVVRLLVERQSELWTLPAELLHEAYIHLAHTEPAHLDSLLLRRTENSMGVRRCSEVGGEGAAEGAGEGGEGGESRRVWSREHCLHSAAATGGPLDAVRDRRSEKVHRRRTREAASDASSGSVSSAMTIVTRVRSSEECSSGVTSCTAPRLDSAPDSNDSASDYNETACASDDECVITASLHIPAAFGPPRVAPPRRRSTSGSESSHKRDSAVGSCSSDASSPAASPPPPTAPLRVTLTSAGELRRPTDIDKLVAFGRERNTSDARAVVLRQHDDGTLRPRTPARSDPRAPEPRARDHRTPDPARTQDTLTRNQEVSARKHESLTVKREERREGVMLYKRGELISSAPAPPT